MIDLNIDQEKRKALALEAILLGNPIEAALIQYPRKVIVAPRQSGKTTALIKVGQKIYGKDFLIVTPNSYTAASTSRVADTINQGGPKVRVVPWVNFHANRDWFFVDDFLLYDREKQEMFLSNPRFSGAVTNAEGLSQSNGTTTTWLF